MEPILFFLIDDDEDDTMLFGETVAEIDQKVRFNSAFSGKAALERLQKDPLPTLIFLDLNMPGMDGLECLHLMKSDARLASVPVVIYTTSSHQKDVEASRNAGAVGFVTKPSDIKTLRQTLSRIIERLNEGMDHLLHYLQERTV